MRHVSSRSCHPSSTVGVYVSMVHVLETKGVVVPTCLKCVSMVSALSLQIGIIIINAVQLTVATTKVSSQHQSHARMKLSVHVHVFQPQGLLTRPSARAQTARDIQTAAKRVHHQNVAAVSSAP